MNFCIIGGDLRSFFLAKTLSKEKHEVKLYGFEKLENFKECEKSTLDPGFVKYSDTTLEVNEYNAVCKKLDSYKRALVENEFTDLKESTTIDCGSSFIILYDDTKEEETYTLVQNMIGLTRNNVGKDKNYMVKSYNKR